MFTRGTHIRFNCTLQAPCPVQHPPAANRTSSIIPPPKRARLEHGRPLNFSREATEIFSTYREVGCSEQKADNMLKWASNSKFRGDRVRFGSIRSLSRKAVKEYLPLGVQSADFTQKLDGPQKIIFYYRDLYDAAKELLKNPKFAGKQYTEAEIRINAQGLREFSAFNTGKVFEAAQVYAGDKVSPIPIFLSSDATLIGKRGGAHPIISEYT